MCVCEWKEVSVEQERICVKLCDVCECLCKCECLCECACVSVCAGVIMHHAHAGAFNWPEGMILQYCGSGARTCLTTV